MENLDIIVLSSIVTTLFAVFIGYTIKELIHASKNPDPIESSPRANMIKFVGKLFDSPFEPKTIEEKKIIYKNVQKVISDMESDGVYFPEEVKEELRRKREELWCEYSNLPSVKSYEDRL